MPYSRPQQGPDSELDPYWFMPREWLQLNLPPKPTKGILCVPSNSTRQGWLSGTRRSYLYSTISSMDAHGLEGPWSFQRDLKITLEIKKRKVDPQLPKGLDPQLPKGLQPKWNHMPWRVMACDSTGYVFDCFFLCNLHLRLRGRSPIHQVMEATCAEQKGTSSWDMGWTHKQFMASFCHLVGYACPFGILTC